MLYLYLDESGDLGFDFVNKKPSEHFTVCVLAIKGVENDRALTKAVQAVIRRRVFPRYRSGNLELKGSIDPLVPLDIFHVPSQESPGLQAADMFSWGVFRKHERRDLEWYGVFSGKISSESVYGAEKEEERAGQAHRPGS